MIKYSSFKKFVASKIIAFVEKSLDEQDFVKKRAENTLIEFTKEFEKNQCEKYHRTNESIVEIEDKINDSRKEMFRNFDKMKTHRKEIDKIVRSLNIEQILSEHVHNLDQIYISKKLDLNDHYYLLQKAFNDYVQTRPPELRNEGLEDKIKALEDKMTAMFFNPDNMSKLHDS